MNLCTFIGIGLEWFWYADGGGDEILLLCDAAGNKLAKRVKQGVAPAFVRHYLGKFVWDGTQLDFLAMPEGWAVPDLQGPNEFRYEYHNNGIIFCG
ncbi:MAG TPA: hypothetical protein ENJ82_00715 [Bacteroidetes bacterium]|nr:hypothetical protein [Bacteroidota bacterium]